MLKHLCISVALIAANIVSGAVVIADDNAATPLVAASSWRAGMARAKITPAEPMWMAGYAGRDRPAEGTLTDLWAKVLVLEDASGRRGVVVTLDLIGIDRVLSKSVCDQIIEKFNFERSEIAICTSHTHTGPVVGRGLATMHYDLVPAVEQARINDYATRLESQIVATVGRAVGDMSPVELSSGTGTATFATNRRNNAEKEVPVLRTAGALAGPTDHDVPVLAVRDRDGKLRAVLFGYACHATVLATYDWSGDYPGFAQAEFERLHPDCQAMFWAGCGGDQNPLPRRTSELAEHYGRRLAGAVESVIMTQQMQPVSPVLQTSYSEIALPFSELPTGEELRVAADEGNPYEQVRARRLLQQLDTGNELEKTYPYPIGVWKFGKDVRWIVLGGEVVVDYSIQLKSESVTTWVAGYSNDVMAYIPSRRVLREGGYEGATSMVYYGQPTSWAPDIERMIIDEVARQLSVQTSSPLSPTRETAE